MTTQVLAELGQSAIDTSKSPYAKLCPVGVSDVTLNDTFWAPRLEVNLKISLPSQYKLLWDTGRIDNFLRVAGKKDVDFQGIWFNDSDVYKWLEAASWALAAHPEDTELRSMVDEAVAIIEGAQDVNGYLNTYFSLERAHERFTNFDAHEMYCAGHLFQAAAANYRATKKTRLLNVALRYADHICDLIGPEEQGKSLKLDGHEEIKMALVELYRITGETRYLDQARFFLDNRGRSVMKSRNPAYYQDHKPYREFTEVTGHAVRMLYLECGAADIYLETGDETIKEASLTHWDNFTGKKQYITGGAGARHEGEAFGENYELANATAYAETCAAIGSIMWNLRLLQISGESRFADEIETALYNGFLSGYSVNGLEYFYVNPLADDGRHRRQEWYGCACCPPNVARQLSSLSSYFASTSKDTVWLHLYAAGQVTAHLEDGEILAFGVATEYPFDGHITITVTDAPKHAISLNLRIPRWSANAAVSVNGEGQNVDGPGYVTVTRVFRPGDTIVLDLPMEVRRVRSHPYVEANSGRIALVRGPLVYCIEQTDFAEGDVRYVSLPSDAVINPVKHAGLLCGITTLESTAVTTNWDQLAPLYADASNERAQKSIPFKAIPYFAWANREAGPMTVWIPET